MSLLIEFDSERRTFSLKRNVGIAEAVDDVDTPSGKGSGAVSGVPNQDGILLAQSCQRCGIQTRGNRAHIGMRNVNHLSGRVFAVFARIEVCTGRIGIVVESPQTDGNGSVLVVDVLSGFVFVGRAPLQTGIAFPPHTGIFVCGIVAEMPQPAAGILGSVGAGDGRIVTVNRVLLCHGVGHRILYFRSRRADVSYVAGIGTRTGALVVAG